MQVNYLLLKLEDALFYGYIKENKFSAKLSN